MNTRFLIGMGVAFALVFIGGVAAVMSINSVTDRNSVTDVSSAEKVVPAPTAVTDSPAPVPAPIPMPVSGDTAPVTAGAPMAPVTVGDSDLANLAAAVKLGQTSTGDVTKTVWARELPIAQKLQQGMCDCDQRNWLNHFVETAQEAISGSDHYPESVQLLAKLRRSNTDLTSSQAAH